MQLPPLRYDDPIFFYDFVSVCQGKLDITLSPHDRQLITDNAIPSKNDPSERQFPVIKQNGTSGFFGVSGYFGAVPVWEYDPLSSGFIPKQFYGFRLTGFNNQILDLRGGYAGPYQGPNEIGAVSLDYYSRAYQQGYDTMGWGCDGNVCNTADYPCNSKVSLSGIYPPPASYFDGDNVYFISPGIFLSFAGYGSPLPENQPLRNKGFHAHISNNIAGNITSDMNLAVDFDDCVSNVAPSGNDLVGVMANYFPSHGGYILGHGGGKGHYGRLSVATFQTIYTDKPQYMMSGGGSPCAILTENYFNAEISPPSAMQWIEAERLLNNTGLDGGFINSLICSDLSFGFETSELQFAMPNSSCSSFMIDPARGNYVQGISFTLKQNSKTNGSPQKICDPGFYFPGLWGDAALKQSGVEKIDYWDVGNGFRTRDPLRIGLSSQASGYFQTSRRRIILDRHGDILIPPNYLPSQLPDGGWLFLPPNMTGDAKKQTCTGFLVTGDGSAYWEVNLHVTPFSPPAWDGDPNAVGDGKYQYPSGIDANISCAYGKSKMPDGSLGHSAHGNFGISLDGVLFYIDTYRTPGVLYSSLGNITVTIPKVVIPKHEISVLCRQFGSCYYPWVG